MRKITKILGEIALLVAIVGFFQPVACEQKGPELTKYLFNMGTTESIVAAIGLIALVIFAALGLIIGVCKLAMKKNDSASTELICTILSIAGGAVTFLSFFKQISTDVFEYGAYMILVSLILALVFFIIAKFSKN